MLFFACITIVEICLLTQPLPSYRSTPSNTIKIVKRATQKREIRKNPGRAEARAESATVECKSAAQAVSIIIT